MSDEIATVIAHRVGGAAYDASCKSMRWIIGELQAGRAKVRMNVIQYNDACVFEFEVHCENSPDGELELELMDGAS